MIPGKEFKDYSYRYDGNYYDEFNRCLNMAAGKNPVHIAHDFGGHFLPGLVSTDGYRWRGRILVPVLGEELMVPFPHANELANNPIPHLRFSSLYSKVNMPDEYLDMAVMRMSAVLASYAGISI